MNKLMHHSEWLSRRLCLLKLLICQDGYVLTNLIDTSDDIYTAMSSETPDLSTVTSLTDHRALEHQLTSQSLNMNIHVCCDIYLKQADRDCKSFFDESSKKGDQPSPVSVLEASYDDNVSSSFECFENVSADLKDSQSMLRFLESSRQVEAVEASFGLNSQTAKRVQGLKDKDSGAAVDGVNPASGNMLQQEKQKSCALGTLVENENKKQAHVEAAEDAVCGLEVMGLEEANSQGLQVDLCQCCNMRHYEDNTDNLRDFVYSDICGSVDVVNIETNKTTSMILLIVVSPNRLLKLCALTFATGIDDVGNVVLVTPPQQNETRSHMIEDDDDSKKGDQPSTVSVLEASYDDNVSSSFECFENVSADLKDSQSMLRFLESSRQVEAVEASFGLNSQTAEGVQDSKDKDSGAAVDGVNPGSEKQKGCALGTVVENESKKRAHVEAAEDVVCGDISSMPTETEGDKPSPVLVLEASYDDKVSSNSKCFKNVSADLKDSQSMLRFLVVKVDEFLIRQVEAVEASFGLNSQTAKRVQGLKDKDSGAAVDGVNPASGNMLQQEKQKSCALGTLVENENKKQAHVEAAEDAVCGLEVMGLEEANSQGLQVDLCQCCNMRHYEDNTDNLRDFIETNKTTSMILLIVVSPNRLLKLCALTFATGIDDVGNVVLVTPPQQNEKRSHMIEDDDEYFDPTLTNATQVHGREATKTGTLSCAHNDETPSGESDHIVLVTPQKQYNKHNRVIEADDEFVSHLFTQTIDFEGGEVCIPRKHFPSTSVTVSCTQSDETYTCASVDLGQANTPEKHNTHSRVIEDEDLFVDPPVRISSQVQSGEAFMKGIQVSEMYGYNDVVHVFNDMEGNGFQPQDIDFSKEDSDIFVGRQFKDKAQFKLTMSIYAIAEVCRFKFRHCKRYVTAKCQMGDSPTYFVKKASLGHQCTSDMRGPYKKHGTSRVLAALLRSKYERLH
ncbi:LOW QUALITY PROTEIN: hypothetical protein HID58_033414, partial [Brassica napus]